MKMFLGVFGGIISSVLIIYGSVILFSTIDVDELKWTCGENKVIGIRYECRDGKGGCTKILKLDNDTEIIDTNRIKQTPNGTLCIGER